MSDKFNTEMLDIVQQHLQQEEKPVEANNEVENKIQNETEKEFQENQESLQKDVKTDELENKEEVNLDKELSGLPKDLIEEVKSFKDPEDKAKAIKIAKEQRAREDRLHLELGKTKKELKNVSKLFEGIQTNPAETFKALAREVKFDLTQALEEPVQAQDDLYLTPEELIERKTKDIQQNLYKSNQEQINLIDTQELLEDFLSNNDYSEDFIAENQSEFVAFYNKELTKDGLKNYYSRKSRMEAMKNAYSKLERLQPDYENKLRIKLQQELEEDKKNKFDEAKRQQKISKSVSNINKSLSYDDKLLAIIKDYI